MFSIVVPVFNKRDFLPSTVASALAQTFSDFELILIDDGSTDESLSTVAHVSDPRIRVMTQSNQGSGAARNAGAAAARSDWIAFLDADDLWDDGHLAELDKVRRAHPEAGLIGSSYRIGSVPPPFEARQPSEPRIGVVDYFNAVASGTPILCTSTAAIRRDVWVACGGFGSSPWGEDSKLWVRIASQWSVATSSLVSATYVQNTGGISDVRALSSFGKPVSSLAELSPAVEWVLKLRSEAPADRKRVLDRYVGRYLHCRLRAAVRDGDLAAVRSLRRLYRRLPSFIDLCLLSIAAMPAQIARALYLFGGWSSPARDQAIQQ